MPIGLGLLDIQKPIRHCFSRYARQSKFWTTVIKEAMAIRSIVMACRQIAISAGLPRPVTAVTGYKVTVTLLKTNALSQDQSNNQLAFLVCGSRLLTCRDFSASARASSPWKIGLLETLKLDKSPSKGKFNILISLCRGLCIVKFEMAAISPPTVCLVFGKYSISYSVGSNPNVCSPSLGRCCWSR